MKRNTNPLRWLMYLAVVFLVFHIVQIYLDATISGAGEIFGIAFHSRGPLNPIAPFWIGCESAFLYLYYKRSKYAWHLLIIPAILGIPAYWALRMQGIYFQPPKFVANDWFTLAVYLGFVIYMIKSRPQYIRFLASDKGREREGNAQDTCDYLLTSQELTPAGEKLIDKTSQKGALKPETQVRIGQVAGFFIIVPVGFVLYILISNAEHIKLPTLSLAIALCFIVAMAYVYGLKSRRLTISKIAYYIWLVFALLGFIFVAFHKLILMGDFSNFLSLWAPLGIVTIFWWVGVRGLTRVVEPETEATDADTLANLFMYIGVFFGFFCGGKITRDFLASCWPHVPYYDKVRSILPCLAGAVAGSFVGAFVVPFVVGFVGLVIDRFRKFNHKKRREENRT